MTDYYAEYVLGGEEPEFRRFRNYMWMMAELICAIAAKDWAEADYLLRLGESQGFWRLDSAEAWSVT